MRFKEYITEKEEKHAVMAFGRMNPITNGHQKLVDTVKNLANKFNAYHNIVLSHSQDSKKNPLSAQQKIKHAKRAFPGVNFSASDHTAPNFLSQAAKLFQSGITHLHMVGGSDRVKEFMTTLKKYNGTHVGALFNFKKVHVHSAGERDPDAEGTTGISASKMRDHAINGNFAEFRKGAPTTMSDAHVKQMYNDVRKGMSVKEESDFILPKDINKSLFMKEEPQMYNEWKNEEPVKYAKYLTKHFGIPDELTGKRAIWYDKDGFKRIEVLDEYILHASPLPHYDFVYCYIDLKVPHNLANKLAESSESITIDFLKNEVGARCASLSANAVTLDYVLDVVEGRITPSKKEYEDRIKSMKNMFASGKKFELDWWPDESGDADPKNPYYKESVNETCIDLEFEELLTEGVHDKGIFKAVFLAGGPGSGKDYVLSNTLDGHGLVEINSDKALEFLMDKRGLDKTMPAAEKASRDQVRGRAKDITELKQRLALKGRNGLIVNGTGDDVEKISRIKKKLEEIGYETSMLMVNTSDEVSAARNIERGQRGGRTVPETVRKQKWDAAQNGRTEYAKMFGANYMEFDNSEDLRNADPDTVKSKKIEMMELFKNVQDFIVKPPKNPAAEEWVAAELEKKDTYRVPKNGVEQVPPSDDGASAEARKLGLKYYGFGRYGINNEVTHRSIHGKLVPVKKDVKESIDDEFTDFISEDLRKWFDPKHPKGGWKRINSKGEAIGPCAREPGEPKPKCMSNEKRASLSKKERAAAVAVKRKHDPNPERKGKPINVSNFGKGKLSESFDLSDSSALNLLLLGTEIDEHDLPMGEEKEQKLLKDKAGRVRIFMLRAAAAREAHTHNGLVLKYKNGYIIQLKENENVNEVNSKVLWEFRREGRETSIGRSSEGSNREGQQILRDSTEYSGRTKDQQEGVSYLSEQSDHRLSDTITEEKTSQETRTTKITLAEIRAKKEKLQEETLSEIDKGIEPGLSMATSGENMGRGSLKVKQIKKPLEELTGDETTASISAQVEDGLKKKGMDLKTFRSKRPIG
jgi:nicotinamide mononucleotide adenylyltransferase